MLLSLRLDKRCRSLAGEKWQPVFSICFCSRRDFPGFIYSKHLSPARRDVTLPEMEFINFHDEYTRWRRTKSICLLLGFFLPLSISSSTRFFMMPSAQSHPPAPPCTPRPFASAAWQILLLPLALSVWSSPANQCLQPLEWPDFMFCKLIGRQCCGILFLDPADRRQPKGSALILQFGLQAFAFSRVGSWPAQWRSVQSPLSTPTYSVLPPRADSWL